MKRTFSLIILAVLFFYGCKPAQISGNVLISGKALANVQIILKGAAVKGTLTGKDGRFSFSGLEPGIYILTPQLEGYTFEPENIKLLIAEKSRERIDFAAVMMNPCGGENEAVSACQDGDDVSVGNSLVKLRYNLKTGRYSIYDEKNARIIENAEAVIYSNVLSPLFKWHSSNMPESEFSIEDTDTVLGMGKKITVKRQGQIWQPNLIQAFTILDSKSCIIFDAEVENSFSWDINIGAIYPLMADGSKSRLDFGTPSDQRILTNGFLNYLDFLVPIQPGTTPVHSNWSVLVYNQLTKKSLSAGALTYETAQPIVYVGPSPLNTGQTLHMVAQYEPAKKLAAGKALKSETMILDFGQNSPQLALETYADRIKAWLGIQTWLERHPDMKTPAGWNSWSGSSSSGGYGTGINEKVILENLNIADSELRRWGMNYFQIDDGWQTATGDWKVNKDRFPDHGGMNGIEWLLRTMEGLGFIPGMWIQGFNASANSQIYNDHPDWFAGGLFGGLIKQDEKVLDLSHPEVKERLAEVMNKLKAWGCKWVKLDFGYTAAMSEGWHEPNLTRGEFYRKGVRTVKDTLGDDVFFLNVAIAGWNYGLIDGMRLTLDTMPAWDGEAENPDSALEFFDNQGLKPMYRDCARRYYLNNRIWINHPDLIFFRQHKDENVAPLTFNESMTFATAVALQSGIVKIGDRIVDLKPDAIDCLRKILPVSGKSGRPLDLFERYFPEVWSIDVKDFDEPYHVIGLLNWGSNKDLTVTPVKKMDDATRIISADFAVAGIDRKQKFLAFEFWTQKFLGEVSGSFKMEVPARTPRVVALRPKLGRPQFLGTNRHITGGTGVIGSINWDASKMTLTGIQEGSVGTVSAPFEHQLTFYCPERYRLSDAKVTAPYGYRIDGKDVMIDGNIITLRFAVNNDESAEISRKWHPDIRWELTF